MNEKLVYVLTGINSIKQSRAVIDNYLDNGYNKRSERYCSQMVYGGVEDRIKEGNAAGKL